MLYIVLFSLFVPAPVSAQDDASAVAVPEKIKIGLIQFAFIPGDIDANIAQAEPLIKETADQGAQIVLLPELWSVGYGIDQALLSEPYVTNKTLNFMIVQARQCGIYVCGGYAELAKDNKPFSSTIPFHQPQRSR